MADNKKHIRIGAVLSYVGVFFGIATGILYNPWMIKNIGDSDYGLYTLAMSLVNTFLVDFGLSMAAQRYISKYLAEKNQDGANDIVGLIYRLYFIISLVLLLVFFVLFFFIENIYAELTVAELSKFKVLFIMVAAYSIVTFPFVTLNSILSAYEKFIPLKVCDLLYKVISIGLTIIALFLHYGVYVLVVTHLIASIVTICIRLIVISRCTPLKVNFHFYSSNKAKELLGFSIWTAISTLVSRLILTLGPSILGAVSGSMEIAIFGYAVSIEGYVYTFVNAINGFFMPKLSRISTYDNPEKQNAEVLNLMVKVGRFILSLFSLIFIGFMVMGQDFISLLVGENYYKAYYCVLLICGYGFIAYPQQIANTYTIVQNRVKKRAFISILSIVVYAIVAIPFGKLWGSVGVALSIGIALVLQTVLMNILYYKDLKINVWCFFRDCHLRSLPGLLLFALFGLVISKYFIMTGWLGFVLKTGMICAIYLIIGWLLLLSRNERKAIIEYGKKRIKRKC